MKIWSFCPPSPISSCLRAHHQLHERCWDHLGNAKGLRSSVSGWGVKDKYYNKRCSYYPFPSGNSPSVRSLCQELGTKAKYTFIIIVQHHTLMTGVSLTVAESLSTFPLCFHGFLLHTWWLHLPPSSCGCFKSVLWSNSVNSYRLNRCYRWGSGLGSASMTSQGSARSFSN